MFKNAIFYRLTEQLSTGLNDTGAKLTESALVPCNSQELSRIGFVPPHPDHEFMILESSGNWLITARKEKKILPPKVIRKALAERVKKIESEQARKVYRKEKLQLKDEIVLDMLPRAFSKFSDTRAIIMPKAGLIVVEAGSFSQAEELLNLLRNALGSLPVALPSVNDSPSIVMSDMLSDPQKTGAEAGLFKSILLGCSCELEDPVYGGGTIKIKNEYLLSDEVIAHIEAGKQVTSLAFEWRDSYRVMLHDDLRIKGIKMSYELSKEVNEESSEDPIDRLRADVFLHSAKLEKLWSDLAAVFGGEVER